jgi:type IV secretory pathway protease TraF
MDRNYDQNFLTNIPTNIPIQSDGTPALIPGIDYNPTQAKDRNVDAKAAISVTVNTGPSMADENVIVDAVQNALNEIARRGYLTTYAGALPA